MKTHRKVLSWIIDYGYMVKGALQGIIYHNPPKHYLEHVVDGKVPVILVPGIFGKWTFLKSLGDKISSLGHPVYIVPGLGYNIFTIPTSAKIVRSVIHQIFPSLGHITPRMHEGAETIEKVLQEKDLKGIVLVAHSKGGLIGKYFLAHFNKDNRVLGLIAIGTPFSGSAIAKLLPLDPVNELRADSQIIRDLEAHTAVNHKIVSICPAYDNHVWSEKGSYLEGAINVPVAVHGHHKVVSDPEVEKIVLQYIEKFSNEK